MNERKEKGTVEVPSRIALGGSPSVAEHQVSLLLVFLCFGSSTFTHFTHSLLSPFCPPQLCFFLFKDLTALPFFFFAWISEAGQHVHRLELFPDRDNPSRTSANSSLAYFLELFVWTAFFYLPSSPFP